MGRRIRFATSLVALVVLASVSPIGSGIAEAAPAPARQTPKAVTISASVSPTQLVVGTTAVVTGKVVPANATPTVFVQRKLGSTWSDRASARVDRKTGAFRLTIRPSSAASYTLRIRSAGGSVVSRNVFVQSWASKQVVSGQGTARTGRTHAFQGGKYNVVASYGAACHYSSVLTGTPGDIRSSHLLPGGSGPRAYKMDVAGVAKGLYSVEVTTALATGCPWTLTFYRY